MPIDFATSAILYGLPEWFPQPMTLAKFAGALGLLAGTKFYCSGASNRSERGMHGRVVMITGGTSGIGAAVALDLAKRGAHIVLLTAQPPSDPILVDYVNELRKLAGHQLIYAEQVDLSSLHSVRKFATQWLDNLPVRRLDMVILCAAVAGEAQTNPRTGKALKPARGVTTADGIERTWQVNYLANFHLLSMLSPALRSQPFDRDVRVIVTTCSSYIGAPPLTAPPAQSLKPKKPTSTATTSSSSSSSSSPTSPDGIDIPDWTPARAYARSKLALMAFARAFQKSLDDHKRPDKLPGNVRVLLVDPGMSRTPGFRRWLTSGSLLWLVLGYVLLYPIWWLFIKSADDGAQSILYAAMDNDLRRMRDFGAVGDPLVAEAQNDSLAHKIVKECRLMDTARRDVEDESVAKALCKDSQVLVETTEKRSAEKRKRDKEAQEKAQKEEERVRNEKQRAEEIEALVSAIKKGKEREKEKEKEKVDKKKAAKRKA
ncbi:MAG: hypothetical protein STHCBS139747_000415 [Sporothrix thermara]